MILGLGCDIVNIERLTKSPEFLERFKQKICGSDELKEISSGRMTYQEIACSLAKLYAGKEAFSKALGTGFRNGIFLKDIQILHNSLGKPELKISGKAAVFLHSLTANPALHISLSDDAPYAGAVVIIEQ